MEFIDYQVNTGIQNMRIDEEILNNAILNNKKNGIFRLYGWSPACVSIGRNQRADFLDKNALTKNEINCVKRLTGGRALVHDKELTYSCVVPISVLNNGKSILSSYKEISRIWIDIFKKFDITLSMGELPVHITNSDYCMTISTGADLCYEKKKFIGSAQYRKNGYILQHGSILLDYDAILVNEVFGNVQEFSSMVSLKQINSDLTLEEVICVAKKYLTDFEWQ